MIPEGSTVRLKAPAPQGEVQDVRLNKAEGQLEYLVDWVDDEGDNQQRWFLESQLEVVSDAQ